MRRSRDWCVNPRKLRINLAMGGGIFYGGLLREVQREKGDEESDRYHAEERTPSDRWHLCDLRNQDLQDW